MEATTKAKIVRMILEKFPATDPDTDIDWEIAEITWKARDPEIAEARKAGMREVVEWFFARSTAQETDFTPKIIAFTMNYEEWQAFLKAKGLE